jgi:hypothetical protein
MPFGRWHNRARSLEDVSPSILLLSLLLFLFIVVGASGPLLGGGRHFRLGGFLASTRFLSKVSFSQLL